MIKDLHGTNGVKSNLIGVVETGIAKQCLKCMYLNGMCLFEYHGKCLWLMMYGHILIVRLLY